ncbi:MAG: hypothetical protein IK066_09870, partial [Kiritimatiellae bacterium]|nr:hypothetical protein [Kiritimatiellia bacterium]
MVGWFSGRVDEGQAMKSVLVCGMGKSGLAAAKLGLREGWRVVVADTREEGAWGEAGRAAAEELRAAGAEVVSGVREAPQGPWDEGVASPGLPVDGAFLRGALREAGRVASEVEWGRRRWGGRVAVVTGSNGKSSVVKALAELLGGTACGNYGLPVSEAAARGGGGWLVIEASSFQMETCPDGLGADMAICLNLLPNHLDRHGDMETYGRLKARVFRGMRGGGLALVPAGLEGTM